LSIDVLSFYYYRERMPVVSVKLDSQEFQRLKAEASRLGISQSEMIRQGLKTVMENKAKTSLADRMRDLINDVKAPEDLSTNPEYLNDYGK
jgi:hypothetical protein